MSFKPDYGLRLLKDGVSPNVDQFFYDFPLASLTVLGLHQYSTTIDLAYQGELHAVSLDFGQRELEKILSKAPEEPARQIRKELTLDSASPRTIEIGRVFTFGVKARLGELQTGQFEQFVPLVAREIL